MQTTLTRTLGLVFALLLSVHSASAEESPDVTEQEIARLITQLGDVSYLAREAAAERLLKIGFAASAQVNEAAYHHANLEIRQRAIRLSTLIAKAALENFASGSEEGQNLTLPGWERYRRFVGEDLRSRRFFVQMHRHQSELLGAYENDLDEAAKKLEICCKHYQGRPLTWWPLTAMLLVAGDERIDVSEQTQLRLCELMERVSRGGRKGDALNRPFRKLLIPWMDGDNSADVVFAQLQVAMRYDFRANFDRILALAANRDFPVERRVHVLISIANFNDASSIPLIEPLLEDQTPYKKQFQIRDVALGVLVYLSSQDPEAYGFYDPDSRPGQFGFSKLQDRDRALAKWHSWSEHRQSLAQTIKAFTEEEGKGREVALPGWKHYRRVAGNTPDSRALFVEMHLAESELLNAFERNSEDLPQCFQQCFDRVRVRNKRAVGLATLLLVAGDEKVKLSMRSATQMLSLLQGWDVARVMEHQASWRKLLGNWLVRSSGTASRLSQLNKLVVAMRYDVPEGVDIAVDLLRQLREKVPDSKEMQATQYILVLQAFAKLGNAAHIKSIEPLLENESVLVAAETGKLEIQLRDLVLAALVHLSGQDWQKYKFRSIGPDDILFIDWSTARFDSNRDRALALEMWRAWSKDNAGTR